jgi:hypothetical protein
MLLCGRTETIAKFSGDGPATEPSTYEFHLGPSSAGSVPGTLGASAYQRLSSANIFYGENLSKIETKEIFAEWDSICV